ncbi:unnamed protein product [Malus baccata var. baccata]
MLVSRCAVQFSLGTFFKRLPVSNPATLCPYRFRPKTLTATLDSRQKEQVHLYVDTLLQWNQKMNLTAVKEADEVMERHIEDSLAIIPPIRNSYLSHCNPLSKNLRLVDVGSCAGLPGLILAIAWPGWEVTLMESMNKRCIFRFWVLPLESHSPYGQRTPIVCLKTFPTPWKYPRDPGTPEKIPL